MKSDVQFNEKWIRIEKKWHNGTELEEKAKQKEQEKQSSIDSWVNFHNRSVASLNLLSTVALIVGIILVLLFFSVNFFLNSFFFCYYFPDFILNSFF